MAFFEWDERYSVGIRSIDLQHQGLIDLINRLHAIQERGGDLSGVIDRLDWYVKHHFSFEESLMRAAGYPKLEAHIEEHRAFERWLRTSQAAARSGQEVREMSRIIEDYLKDWLREHILVVDMDYKALLTGAMGRGGSLALLASTLVESLEEARSKPTTEAIDRALALAADIKQTLDEAADAPGPGHAGETT